MNKDTRVSRWRSALRIALPWVIAIVVSMAYSAWEAAELRSALDDLDSRNSDLEYQLADLESRMTALKADVEQHTNPFTHPDRFEIERRLRAR